MKILGYKGVFLLQIATLIHFQAGAYAKQYRLIWVLIFIAKGSYSLYGSVLQWFDFEKVNGYIPHIRALLWTFNFISLKRLTAREQFVIIYHE